MYVSIRHTRLCHHLKGSGDVGVPHDVIKSRDIQGVSNDAQGCLDSSDAFLGSYGFLVGVVRYV